MRADAAVAVAGALLVGACSKTDTHALPPEQA